MAGNNLTAGKLAVRVHSASGFQASAATSEHRLPPGAQVYCVCEVPGYGRLCTEPGSVGAAPDDPTMWEQELTFEVGPGTGEPSQLKAALYAVTPDGQADTDEFIGSGSLNLAHLAEVHQQKNVRVPLVSGAGAHLGDLSLDLRFFHSRSPGRQRDAVGREWIDQELVDAGPTQAARILNERSPRSPRAGSPRLKPPPQDPPVPELQATLHTTLTGEE